MNRIFRLPHACRSHTFLLLALVSCGYARLGENRAALVGRLGPVRLEAKHFFIAQGQSTALVPALFFEKDQWAIQCDRPDVANVARTPMEVFGTFP